VRIRISIPPGGFGQRHRHMSAWLDENCGADGWAMTPSGSRGVLNDAVSIFFLDATAPSWLVDTAPDAIARDVVSHLVTVRRANARRRRLARLCAQCASYFNPTRVEDQITLWLHGAFCCAMLYLML
jgi:hypothetical protein